MRATAAGGLLCGTPMHGIFIPPIGPTFDRSRPSDPMREASAEPRRFALGLTSSPALLAVAAAEAKAGAGATGSAASVEAAGADAYVVFVAGLAPRSVVAARPAFTPLGA